MSTIRLIVETWTVIPGTESYTIERSLGHATVMGGRYLVTHNHYQPGLDPRAIGDDETFAIVYLFDHKGELFYRGMLSHFRLVVEDTETLVLSHEDEDFFGRYGLPSAAFAAWPALGLHAGMEVAQVDWDGETTRVDWVTVADVIVDDGTPRLVLDDGLTRGASGGGIFWNGVHVANNWRYQEQIDGAGIVIDTVTSVALNSVDVARP